jgi:hypothetical protein
MAMTAERTSRGTTEPYLSVVIPSRNDNHGGDMPVRMKACVYGLLQQAQRHGLNLELLLIEWNPPADRPLLKDVYRWPASNPRLRIITVPHRLHLTFPHSEKKPMHPTAGWNVGIVRARGRFVLTTTVDVLLSDDLTRFLATETLDPGMLYRIDRSDVDRRVLEHADLSNQLEYSRRNIIGVMEHKKHTYPERCRIPQLHLGAAGDFILLSRERWLSLRGFPEFDILGGVDATMCYMAYLSGAREVVLRPPCYLYHIDHDDTSAVRRSPSTIPIRNAWRKIRDRLPQEIRRQIAATVDEYYRKRNRTLRPGVPYLTFKDEERIVLDLFSGRKPVQFNDENWGLRSEVLDEASPGETALAPTPCASETRDR